MSSSRFYLYRRSNGIWYIGYIHEGRKVWKSSGTKLKAEALNALKDFEYQSIEKIPKLSFTQFVEQFCTLRTNDLRDTTIKRIYLPSFKAFEHICGNKLISSYTLQDIEIFKHMRLKSCTPTTVSMQFRSLKAAFNIALKWQLITTNPFTKSSSVRVPQSLPLYITKRDFQLLLQTTKEPVLKELFLVAALSGLRQGELLNLKWSNIDMQRHQISVTNSSDFHTKTGKSRIVPMNEMVFQLLGKKINSLNACPFIFHKNGFQLNASYAEHKFKKYIRQLGLNDQLHFHSLRHTFATWLVQGGVNIYEVQKLLGHSSVKVTEVYSHLAASELHSSVNRINLQELT